MKKLLTLILAFVVFFFTSRFGGDSKPKQNQNDADATYLARAVPNLVAQQQQNRLSERQILKEGIINATTAAEKLNANVGVPEVILVDVASFYKMGESPVEFAQTLAFALHKSYPELAELNANGKSKAKIIFYATSKAPYINALGATLDKGVLGFASEFRPVDIWGADISSLLKALGYKSEEIKSMTDKTFLIRSNRVTHAGDRLVGVENFEELPLAIHAYGRFGEGGRALLIELLKLLKKFEENTRSLDDQIKGDTLSALAA
jgi:hypothetical protein